MIKNKFSTKRLVICVLAVALVAGIAAGATFAWFGGVSHEQVNVFTGAENIRAKLSEPNWDAGEGLTLVPGKAVRKDPMITNTGQTEQYAALRLTFTDTHGNALAADDALKLINLLNIDWNSKWVICSGTLTSTQITQPLVFYYSDSIATGAASEPIFSQIEVKDKSQGLLEQDLRWLQGIKIDESGEIVLDSDALGGFDIKIEGAAVQAEGFATAADAAGSLIELFP